MKSRVKKIRFEPIILFPLEYQKYKEKFKNWSAKRLRIWLYHYYRKAWQKHYSWKQFSQSSWSRPDLVCWVGQIKDEKARN